MNSQRAFKRALSVLNTELVNLERKHNKAKETCNQAQNAYQRLADINFEFVTIAHNSDLTAAEKLEKLEILEKEKNKQIALTKRDMNKLMDTEFNAEVDVSEFKQLIRSIEYYITPRVLG